MNGARHPQSWLHFGGGNPFHLRVNTGSLFVNVPIDHNARAAIANVPFGQEILVPGGNLLGIGGAGGGGFAPNVRRTHLENRIDNLGNGGSQVVLVNGD